MPRGASPAGEVAGALDDLLYELNATAPQAHAGEPRTGTASRSEAQDSVAVRYPKEPRAYLDDWSSDEAAWLRRTRPVDSDEIHYEVTPSFEKAYGWVTSLRDRTFVGTESRLHTVIELLPPPRRTAPRLRIRRSRAGGSRP